MNIKFGMDNFYVRYLKRFLHQELNQDSNNILGKFDKNDLQQLITYLNLPNVKSMFAVQKEIVEKFPELNTRFVPGLKDDQIVFKSKEITAEDSKFLTDNLDDIKEYCKSVGWEVSDINEWVDNSKDINSDGNVDDEDVNILHDIIFNHQEKDPSIMKKADINLDGKIDTEDLRILNEYLLNSKLYITIKRSTRKNYFPNEDMKIFINQFDGTFLYDYAIRDGRGDTQDDIPHPNEDKLYKVALFKCYPGQKVTIAHDFSQSVHMVIGSSPATLKQNIPGFMLNNVKEIDLLQGSGYQYTCSKAADGTGYNAHWLCIQVPSDYGSLSYDKDVTISIRLGDINLDNEVNLQDYHLLAKYTAYGPGSEELHWTPTRRQLAAMDLNGDGIVDMRDTLRFEEYLHGYIPDLGLAPYTYTIQEDRTNSKNVNNLLIIEGHYYEDEFCTKGDINIPFGEFMKDDWIIHEKFFNYLLDMAIQPYSDSYNISYAQKLLKEVYPEHMYDPKYFYPGVYSDKMKEIVKQFQIAHYDYYYGDLNKDNKIDNVDLQILREYLDDPQHKQHELDPDAYEDSDLLSPIQKLRADMNRDNYVNETDYEILASMVEDPTLTIRNYHVSYNLGYIDVQTEALLEQEYNTYGNISEVSK